MSQKSKRTSAPAPVPVPSPIPPLAVHTVPPSATTSVIGAGTWCPPLSTAPSSMPYWYTGLHQPVMAASSPQGPWCAPAGISASTDHTSTIDSAACSDMQAWGTGSHPPGGFLNFLSSTTNPAQAASNGSASQSINVGDEDNEGDGVRTEKRLLWTKEEDLRLVSAWLNNSNDPIGSNYKKNDQYWKGVAAVYNSTTPKNRVRLAKQIKDRFGRIKKRVAWFCAAWKEANALWASGESDVDLINRALQTYEEDHKTDGPFMFKHCWDVLRKEPKWDAYLLRLDESEPDKRKFTEDEDDSRR